MPILGVFNIATSQRKTAKKHAEAQPAKRPTPPENPESHARKIVEFVEAAWHRTYGTGWLDIPVSVVVTLAAAPQRDAHGNDITTAMTTWNADDFRTYARRVWTSVIQARPETTHLLYSIMAWLFDGTDADTMLTS